ncbi:VOC family protein, partial [Streptomyces sp. 2MCAF27]
MACAPTDEVRHFPSCFLLTDEFSRPGRSKHTQVPDPSRQGEPTMQKITTFLWFDDQAEEAARHYASIFD